jgi:hypothetical protein
LTANSLSPPRIVTSYLLSILKTRTAGITIKTVKNNNPQTKEFEAKHV